MTLQNLEALHIFLLTPYCWFHHMYHLPLALKRTAAGVLSAVYHELTSHTEPTGSLEYAHIPRVKP